jgi:hypothetical protein
MPSESSSEADLLLDMVPGDLRAVDQCLEWNLRFQEMQDDIRETLSTCVRSECLEEGTRQSAFRQLGLGLECFRELLAETSQTHRSCLSDGAWQRIGSWVEAMDRASEQLALRGQERITNPECEEYEVTVERFVETARFGWPKLKALDDLLVVAKAVREKRQGEPAREVPLWDGTTLSFRGVICLTFARETRNQHPLLSAFQAAGWPPLLDSPLSNDRTKQTVTDLNRKLKEKPLKFGFRLTGTQATWEPRNSS